jgi:hypothetical protein
VINLGEDNFLRNIYFYPKPGPGEKIPVQVLNFRRLFAAWSPGLKKTLYFEKLPENESLKRVRKIILLQVFDWLACREGLIELKDPEFERFIEVYENFLQNLGEIQYIRQKKGRRAENIFELEESASVLREVKKGYFSDKL